MTNDHFGGAEPAPTRTVADFAAALDVFKALMGQLVPTGLLGALALMSLASIAASVPLWIGRYLSAQDAVRVLQIRGAPLDPYGPLPAVLQVVGVVLMLLVMAARLGLVRPMRMVMFDGPSAVRGTGDALRLALGGYGPNLGITIVYLVAMNAGGCLCFVPGIVAGVLLYPALYLVATGRDFGGSLSLSVDWVSRHTGALLGTVGLLSAIALVFGCCGCCMGFTQDGGGPGGGPGPMTVVYLLPAGTIVGELLSAVTMTFVASGCIAADQAEAASAAATPAGPF